MAIGTLQSLPSDWLLNFSIGGACFRLNSAFLISVIIFKICSFAWPSCSRSCKSFFSSIIPFRILSNKEYGGSESVSSWSGPSSALGALLRIGSPIILTLVFNLYTFLVTDRFVLLDWLIY